MFRLKWLGTCVGFKAAKYTEAKGYMMGSCIVDSNYLRTPAGMEVEEEQKDSAGFVISEKSSTSRSTMVQHYFASLIPSNCQMATCANILRYRQHMFMFFRCTMVRMPPSVSALMICLSLLKQNTPTCNANCQPLPRTVKR